MTEYGGGRGSQPWHPEDPLYGDPGWDDGSSAAYQGGWEGSYGGQYQAQQQYASQQQYAPQHQYDSQQQYDHPQQYASQQQYVPQQQYDSQQGQFGAGGWDGTQGAGQQQPYDPSYGMGATDPYGMPPVDPYGNGQQPDHYATQDAYPPPQPQHLRGQEPPQQQDQYQQDQYQQGQYQQQDQYGQQELHPEADPETGWDPGPDRGEHAFFTHRDDEDEWDDDAEDDPAASGRKGRRGGRTRRGETKRRSGCACFAVSLVIVAGVGAVGYFGYDFYQSHFAPAPDFEGKGSGETQVDIPDNATISDMGNALKRGGVVKSHDAFVAAAAEGDGDRIQGGTYTMREEMSASAAVRLMLDPASQNALIIPEGSRNSQVYSMIDQKIGLAPGTTEKTAKKKYRSIGLPSWAGGSKVKDPLEGFLYPSRYTVGKGDEPEKVLKQMVSRAEKRYESLGLESKAKRVGLDSPFEVLEVASLVQAEGRTHDDFRKMSEVVYNRLKPGNTQTNGMLEFDSTYNYIKNQSKIDLTVGELRNYKNRYNTYFYKGLPPGPIGNPGDDALKAAMNPDDGGWYYFISLDNDTSEFTKTYSEHQKLVEKFSKQREGR